MCYYQVTIVASQSVQQLWFNLVTDHRRENQVEIKLLFFLSPFCYHELEPDQRPSSLKQLDPSPRPQPPNSQPQPRDYAGPNLRAPHDREEPLKPQARGLGKPPPTACQRSPTPRAQPVLSCSSQVISEPILFYFINL
jgi:hypothetical protein